MQASNALIRSFISEYHHILIKEIRKHILLTYVRIPAAIVALARNLTYQKAKALMHKKLCCFKEINFSSSLHFFCWNHLLILRGCCFLLDVGFLHLPHFLCVSATFLQFIISPRIWYKIMQPHPTNPITGKVTVSVCSKHDLHFAHWRAKSVRLRFQNKNCH